MLPRAPHNAPLHLFSASPDLVGFAGGTYRRRSEDTSSLLKQLFERLKSEGVTMSYTMQDFRRDFMKEHLPKLTPKERAEVLQALPPQELLEALSEDQIHQLLTKLTADRSSETRKRRRKK